MVKDWKKEVKPKLEEITANEGGKLTERVLDYQTSRNMVCLTCENNINSTRAFTLPTEDPEIFRWLCEACGDNVINYYHQLHMTEKHGFEGDVKPTRKIVSMRRFDMKRGDFGTWKLEICIAYFGERYCTNCVYETEMRKFRRHGKSGVLNKDENQIDNEALEIERKADWKPIVLSVKLLESSFEGVDPRYFTTISYLCKKCADEWMRDFRDSYDDIIGFEENTFQEMEQKIEQIFGGYGRFTTI